MHVPRGSSQHGKQSCSWSQVSASSRNVTWVEKALNAWSHRLRTSNILKLIWLFLSLDGRCIYVPPRTLLWQLQTKRMSRTFEVLLFPQIMTELCQLLSFAIFFILKHFSLPCDKVEKQKISHCLFDNFSTVSLTWFCCIACSCLSLYFIALP